MSVEGVIARVNELQLMIGGAGPHGSVPCFHRFRLPAGQRHRRAGRDDGHHRRDRDADGRDRRL